MMPFRTNYHLAEPITARKVSDMAHDNSSKEYVTFLGHMFSDGWDIRLYDSDSSRYVFVSKGGILAKIRFSDHPPNKNRREKDDSDYLIHDESMGIHDVIDTLKWRHRDWSEDL